jgi:hypothetical protein
MQTQITSKQTGHLLPANLRAIQVYGEQLNAKAREKKANQKPFAEALIAELN